MPITLQVIRKIKFDANKATKKRIKKKEKKTDDGFFTRNFTETTMNWFANCESVLEDIIRVLENFLKLSSSIVKGMMERLMHLQKLLEYKSELHTYLEKLLTSNVVARTWALCSI